MKRDRSRRLLRSGRLNPFQKPRSSSSRRPGLKTLSAMALLAFITLSVVTKAGTGPSTLPGQRGTKVQLVQLCQTAHANKNQFLSGEFDELLRELNEERRRHPALPERWACA